MPALQFKRIFVPSILDGSKTQTLRPRVRGTFAGGGTLTLLNGYHATALIGRATIVSAAPIRLDGVTDYIARLDGFDSSADLVAAAGKLYPGIAEFIAIRWRDFIPAR